MFGWLKWLRGGSLAADHEAAQQVRQNDLVARILKDARAKVDADNIGAKETFDYVVRPEMSSLPLAEDIEFGLLIRAGQYGLYFKGVRDGTITFACLY